MTNADRRPAGLVISRAVRVLGCGASFLSFLDAAIVNMTFAPIASAFPGVALATLTWVVSGYAITFAGLLAAAGHLADTMGHRRVMLAGLGAFTAASLLCAVAPTAGWLIAARFAQGGAGALLLPSALGAMLTATGPAKASRVIGAWSASGALAGTAGPAIGALLVDFWGWRSIFALNIPFGVALFALGAYVLPATTRRDRSLPDVTGAVILSAGIAALVAAIAEGHRWGYTSPLTLAVGATGIVTSIWVVRRSHHHRRPALAVSLWRSRCFALNSVASVALGFALFAYLLAIPMFFVSVWHLSLLQSAACVGVGGAAAMAAAMAGRAATAVTARWYCAGGFVVVTAAFVVIASALGPHRNWGLWVVVAIAQGGGASVVIIGLSVITAATVPASHSSAGMGLMLAARQSGGALGVAVVSAILVPGRDVLSSVHELFGLLASVTAAAAILSTTLITRRGGTDVAAFEQSTSSPAPPSSENTSRRRL
ncbi:MFS transporter [Nocardia sp. NPDC052278]|uniref:MFS transporter n=1 Tax=unclassified Nocardia TaxID=2637762 RepID=UPI0036AA8B05